MTETPLDPLSALALRHGTDKYGEHLYTPDYHRLFAHLRDRKLRLLEVGVGGYGYPDHGGQGLRMWAAYFPHAHIVGLDLHPKRLAMPPNVTIRQGSQDDPAVLDRLWHQDGPFDIIIDDGSHQVAHVLATFHHLYPRMADTGIYVVEDTQTAFWPEYGGTPAGTGSIHDLAHSIALGLNRLEMEVAGPVALDTPYAAITHEVRFLRNLIVFQRGDNTYPSIRKFDVSHPGVRAVLQHLDRAGHETATPGPWLTRAKIAFSAGDMVAASIAAATGLARFPGNPDLTQMLALASIRPIMPAAHEIR